MSNSPVADKWERFVSLAKRQEWCYAILIAIMVTLSALAILSNPYPRIGKLLKGADTVEVTFADQDNYAITEVDGKFYYSTVLRHVEKENTFFCFSFPQIKTRYHFSPSADDYS